jgi:hypothetical protein
MRDLKRSDKNVLIINDARSGTEIELYYRNPTTEEEVAYQTKLFKKMGKKVKLNAFDTRLNYGLKILTGFRDGDFGMDGKAISADPAAPDYRPDWKLLLREQAPDIVTTFAFTVFEGARADMGMELDLESADEDGDDSVQVDNAGGDGEVDPRTEVMIQALPKS